MNETQERKTYNGWTNYETWNVKLWLDNEQGTCELQKEMADQARQVVKIEDYWTEEEKNRFYLADMLKDFVEENRPDIGASMYSDLLGAALSEVNWQEIAGAILEDS